MYIYIYICWDSTSNSAANSDCSHHQAFGLRISVWVQARQPTTSETSSRYPIGMDDSG